MKDIIKKYFKYFSFFYGYLRGKFFIMLGLSVLVGFMDGIGLALFMPLLEVVSQPEATNTENMGNMAFIIEWLNKLGLALTLDVVLYTLLTVYLLKGVFKFTESYYKVHMRILFIKKLRFKMIDGLANLRYQKFVTSDAGKIQNSLSGEIGRVVTSFVSYTGTLQAIIMLLVYLGMAFLANAEFAVLVIIGGVLTNLTYQSIYKITKQLSKNIVKVSHLFQGLLIQSVHYFKYLKATSRLGGYAKRLKDLVFEMEMIQKRMGFLNSVLVATREPLVVLVVVIVILVQVNLMGGNLASIILSLLFFYRSLNSLMAVQTGWNSFLNASGSIENAQDFMRELEESKEVNLPNKINGFGKELIFENVSFNYIENVNVLNKINLKIAKNETIAFVGESGSGKTTLMNMVVGLLDNYSGSIAVDQQDYKSFNLKSLQSKIGYITQEPVIFSDTVYNNVTFWAPRTEENLLKFNEVMHKAAIYDFIQSLPNKEQSQLGDNGVQVSGGQKQRISIARELYKDVELLLLDEATSALDSQTEKTIQQNIESLKGKYTIVIVAHRLSTVRNADRIVVLEQGNIEAIGSFDELVETSDRFKRMVELQEF